MPTDIYVLETEKNGKSIMLATEIEVETLVNSTNSNKFIKDDGKISCFKVDDFSKLMENEDKYSSLGISESADCSSINLNMFQNLEIKALGIHNKSFLKNHSMGLMKSVESLGLSEGVKGEIDLSMFPKLNSLDIFKWNKDLHITNGTHVETLRLHSYKPEHDVSFSSLFSMKSLKSIELNLPRLTNLSGIDYFKKLSHVYIHYASKLTDISALAHSSSVEFLMLQNCPNILDFSTISKMKKLNNLRIWRCKSIKSLSFLEGRDQLKDLIVLETKILDGNKDILKKFNKEKPLY